MAGALSYGPREEMLRKAEKRVAALKKQYPDTQVYSPEGVGGTNLIWILRDKPEVYGLPANPKVAESLGLWKETVQPAGKLTLAGTLVLAGFGFIVARRNHLKETHGGGGIAMQATSNLTTRHSGQELVARFSRAQRIAHWLFTAAFCLLTFTGLVLIFPALSSLAVGGVSRQIHLVAAVLFLATPAYYALFDRNGLGRLVRDSFTYDRDDIRWLLGFPRYVLGFAKNMPPQGRINAGEKLHHALIIILFFVISLSGIALWAGKPVLGVELFSWMLIAHDLSMFAMVLLTIGHLYFVFVYGALGGMITGYVTRAYARMEHAKWLTELDAAEGRKSV